MFNRLDMMTKKDILELLKELIVCHDRPRLKLEYSDIHLSDTLDDLGFDSLDVTELAFYLEQKLEIKIKSSEIDNVMMNSDIDVLTNFLYQRYKETREQEI